jgi:hypothetical protein
MWYVEVKSANGKTNRYEGLTKEQAADIHKREWINGADNIDSGILKSNKE